MKRGAGGVIGNYGNRICRRGEKRWRSRRRRGDKDALLLLLLLAQMLANGGHGGRRSAET